jgi:hypothetical protein
MAPRTVSELYRDLRACQRRLGTAHEATDDFQQVLMLAHEINNRLLVEELSRFLAPACPAASQGTRF